MSVPTISTDRLVLRRWLERDRAPFAAMNADPEVMEHFPAPLSREESGAPQTGFSHELVRSSSGKFPRRPVHQICPVPGMERLTHVVHIVEVSRPQASFIVKRSVGDLDHCAPTRRCTRDRPAGRPAESPPNE